MGKSDTAPVFAGLTPEDRELLEQAARQRGVSVEQYIAESALVRARRELSPVAEAASAGGQQGAADLVVWDDLRRQLEMLRAVARRTQNAVIVTDVQGHIEWVNEGFVRLTGYSPEEVYQKRPQDLLQGPETSPAARRKMADAILRREPFQVEVLNYDKARQQYWVAIDAEPTFDAHGAHTGYFAMQSDVTEARVTAASAEVTKRIGDRLLVCDSVETAAQMITEELTQVLDVRAAQIWTVESAHLPLRYVAGSAATSSGQAWLDATSCRTFERGDAWVVGVGAPGMAWGTGQSCVRTDFWGADTNGRFSRRAAAARDAGIRTVCATPVHGPQEIVAIIEIGGSHNYPGHERLPALIARVAQQFGAFLLQRRSLTAAEEANRELLRQIESRSAQLFAALSLPSRRTRQVDDLVPGTKVNDRYLVEQKVGSGGMGAVYRVSRLPDGSQWAMKVATAKDGQTLARLAREANLLSRLRHPNIVQVKDIDIAPRGFLYLVLEFVEGQNLRQWWHTHDDKTFEHARLILEQILLGLQALHDANIAHRDLKPENVLIQRADHDLIVKLADFGISKIAASNTSYGVEPHGALVSGSDRYAPEELPFETEVETDLMDRSPPFSAFGGGREEGPTMVASAEAVVAERTVQLSGRLGQQEPPGHSSHTGTSTTSGRGTQKTATLDLTGVGLLSGTPHYIAPELVTTPSASGLQTDLFSFGVLAHELLTGERPFSHPLALSLLEHPARPLASPRPLPPEWAMFQPLLSRCMAIDPSQRPRAADALRLLPESPSRG